MRTNSFFLSVVSVSPRKKNVTFEGVPDPSLTNGAEFVQVNQVNILYIFFSFLPPTFFFFVWFLKTRALAQARRY